MELIRFTYLFIIVIALIVYLVAINEIGIKKTNKEIFKWSEL